MLTENLGHVILSVLLLVLTVGFSLFSAYTFGVSERLARVFQGQADKQRADYVAQQLKDANAARNSAGASRSSSEIEAERRAILNQGLKSARGTIGSYTSNCVRPTPRTRDLCARYNALAAELAAARTAERAEERRLKLESEALVALKNAKPADTQLTALSELTGYTEKSILQTLAWFLAVLCELGSLLGLYLARKLSGVFDHGAAPTGDLAGGAIGQPPLLGSGSDLVCPLAGQQSNQPKSGIREFSAKEIV